MKVGEQEADGNSAGEAAWDPKAEEARLHAIQPKPYIAKEQFRLDGSYLIVGKRRFGKTTCLRSILGEIGDYYASGVYVFSKTKHNSYWSQHVPEERIYPTMDWNVVDRILEEQKKKREDRKKTGKQDRIPYVFLILDDMISSRHDMRYVERMLNLFFEGRHYDIGIAICAQDVKGIPPDIRQNVDQIFMTWQTQERQITTLEFDFADFGWGKTFSHFLRGNTKDHQMLIIDQSEVFEDVTEQFYSYQPDPHPEPFKLGDFKFWKESGCNWENQQKLWANIQKTDLKGIIDDPALQKLYDEQWKESNKLEKMFPETNSYGNGPYDLKTTAISAADPETQAKYYANLAKKLWDSSAQKAVEDDWKYLYNMYERYQPYSQVFNGFTPNRSG